MRSTVAASLGIFALTLSSAALGDPLPVHTATTRVATTSLQPADRIELADAVAQVFSAANVPDVLTASETRNRLQEINPVGVSCDAASCASAVFHPVRARALILVHQNRTAGRVNLNIEYINLRGEVVMNEPRNEAISQWSDAVAVARIAATRLLQRLRDDERTAVTLVPPTRATGAGTNPGTNPGTGPVTGPVTGPGTNPVTGPAVTPPPVVMVPDVRYERRPWEIGVGAGLIAGGAVLAGFGIANLAAHGTTTENAADHTVTTRCAAGASYANDACDGIGAVTPIMVAAGAVALGGGVYMLIDGLRRRPVVVGTRPASAPPSHAWNVGAAPLAQGAALSLSGTF